MPGAKFDNLGRFDQGNEQLERRSDIGRWEVVRATFTVADQDVLIRHKLPTPDPEQVSYQALNTTGPAVLYHDGTATRRPWGVGYVRLRSRVVPVTMDILLTVQAADIGTIKLPGGAAVTPGTNADTLDGLDSTNFARSDVDFVVMSAQPALVNSEVLTAGTGISIGPGATIVNTDPGSGAAPTELDDIPDVNAPSPTTGDVLTWSGSEWTDSAPPVFKTTVSLTDAQIKALPTTPITLIAAPGANLRIDVLFATLRAKTASGAYTNINATYAALALYWLGDFSQWTLAGIVDDVTAAPALTRLTTLLGTAGTTSARLSPYIDLFTNGWAVPNIVGSTLTDNKALAIAADNNGSGAFTGGNPADSLQVDVFYTIQAAA